MNTNNNLILIGNAAIGRNINDTFLSNYRTGILLHTGEWDHWSPSRPMPNRYAMYSTTQSVNSTILGQDTDLQFLSGFSFKASSWIFCLVIQYFESINNNNYTIIVCICLTVEKQPCVILSLAIFYF